MALLDEVKTRLSIEGTASDSVLKGLIGDVISFCEGAGVPREVASTQYGLVTRGVSDLWEGKERFSSIFRMQLIQLQAKSRRKIDGQ